MAIALARFIPSPRNYPWDQWMNGTAYRAERGVDFKCSTKGFLSCLYARAARAEPKRRTVKTKLTHDGRYVEFQFDDPPKPRKKAKRKAGAK